MPTPPSIPPEILDYIIDLLRDEPETLKRCCLVAKLWIPRTRKHLFADIQFSSIDDLRLWKKTFPDSANSPAYHTRTLFASCAQADVAATVDENGWTRAFSGVTSLSLESHLGQATLVPFHRFSPTLKSLHAHYFIFPSPQLFAFILSSPLLEDLTLAGLDIGRQDDHDDPREPQTAAPSTSPPLTGTLRLHIAGRIEDTVCRLLSLPNGLHFRKLVFSQARSRDVRWIMELLIRCSDSLECLDIMCYLPRKPILILHWRYPLPLPLGSSRSGVRSFDRPFESDKTQKCGFPGCIIAGRMDRHGAPDHRARTSRSSRNFNPYITLFGRFQHQCGLGRSGLWAVTVAGPRSDPRPALGVAFNSPKGGMGRVYHRILARVFVTRGSEERDS